MPGLQIFNTLKRTYGTSTLKTARKWETCAHKIASAKEQLHFLHSCKRLNVLRNKNHIKTKTAPNNPILPDEDLKE